LYISDHNFRTRNATKLIKGSKDLDSSLVSNENFSGWAPGQVTWAKMAQKLLHLWRHSQKIYNLQPKIFFECRVEDLLNLLRVWTAV